MFWIGSHHEEVNRLGRHHRIGIRISGFIAGLLDQPGTRWAGWRDWSRHLNGISALAGPHARDRRSNLPRPEVTVDDRFLDALSHIESGDKDVSGDGGRAQGVLQLWRIYVAEACRLVGCKIAFNGDDRHSRGASREMSRVVLSYWAKYHRGKGRHIGYAELASLHRRPNAKWRPDRLDLPIEKARTKKLMKFLN